MTTPPTDAALDVSDRARKAAAETQDELGGVRFFEKAGMSFAGADWIMTQAFARFERDLLANRALVEALERNAGPLADAARRIAMRLSSTDNGQARAYVAAKEDMLEALSTAAIPGEGE
jgi:hypothetical protein